MRISVIVPIYNVDKFLKQCLNSILNQTKKAHEIILVDDGSTDTCGLICDEYSAMHDNIKVIHKLNAGLGMARNTGLEYVSGDYVTFIDSDDYYELDFLEKMSNIIETQKCDTCKTSFRRVDLVGNFVSDVVIEKGTFGGEKKIKKELIPRLIGSAPHKKDSIPMSVCCTLFSMKIINKYNLRFVSERDWISEDTIFNIMYFYHASKIILADYIGYNYRINTNSLTTKYMPDRFSKCLKMYDKEVDLLKQYKLYEICRLRLDRQFFIYLKSCFSQLKNSDLSKKQRKKEILTICNNIKVQMILKEYPINKLGPKQRAFLYFIKYKLIMIIYFLLVK